MYYDTNMTMIMIMRRFHLLLLLLLWCIDTTESRLRGLTQQHETRRLQEEDNGTLLFVEDDILREEQCEIIVSMIMPNFAFTVGGEHDIHVLASNLVDRSIQDQGVFAFMNITEALISVQTVSPLTLDTQRRLWNDERRYLKQQQQQGLQWNTWGFNSARFYGSISRCRWCDPDDSDLRRELIAHNVDEENWFAYKYLRSVQNSSDWLDDAIYIRIQANCTTLQIDGAYDEGSGQRRLYEGLDDNFYSTVDNDDHDEI